MVPPCKLSESPPICRAELGDDQLTSTLAGSSVLPVDPDALIVYVLPASRLIDCEPAGLRAVLGLSEPPLMVRLAREVLPLLIGVNV